MFLVELVTVSLLSWRAAMSELQQLEGTVQGDVSFIGGKCCAVE